MRDLKELQLPKWPFYFADLVLFGTAALIYSQLQPSGSRGELWLIVACIAAGGVLSVVPFLLEYRASMKLAESDLLAGAITKLKNIEEIASQIGNATVQWNTLQEQSDKTAEAVKQISTRMSAETKEFMEFAQRTNDSEKATLRLEVDKLRRSENDWLQVSVRILDHVYALHQGALRSGQPNLIEQVGQFQNACRDIARRVGLTPFVPNPSDSFDSKRHQLIDGNEPPTGNANVEEVVAAGYTFQGKLLRPALVRLQAMVSSEIKSSVAQDALPLESAKT